MFNRFTQRAQKVLQLAQEEAIRMKHESIGTEHILLGLIREGGGIAAKALEAIDVSFETIEEGVEQACRFRNKRCRSDCSLYTTCEKGN